MLSTTGSILNEFAPITLKEMDSVKLMDRKDTKYVPVVNWVFVIDTSSHFSI